MRAIGLICSVPKTIPLPDSKKESFLFHQLEKFQSTFYNRFLRWVKKLAELQLPFRLKLTLKNYFGRVALDIHWGSHLSEELAKSPFELDKSPYEQAVDQLLSIAYVWRKMGKWVRWIFARYADYQRL